MGPLSREIKLLFLSERPCVVAKAQDLGYISIPIGLFPEHCKKNTRAMRAMRSNARETVPFQPYFGRTESLLKEPFRATRPMIAKRVSTVPLQPYFGFH